VTYDWANVSLQSLSAPDEYSITVVLNGAPNPVAAQQLAAYSVDSPVGSLGLTSLQYDPVTHTIQLSTGRQKLGVTYTLTIQTDAPLPNIVADFDAADTATLWASDFGSPTFADYLVTADRVAVGDHCVIYIEQGMSATDVQFTVNEFDGRIFPALTATYVQAPDVDGNERILLLGLDGGNDYGGYFSPVNQFSEDFTMATWGMHSNEMDMIYINVVGATFNAQHVIPHEFSHLLYAARHDPVSVPHWDYHNEGLAETGVHIVYGTNDYAISYYLWDPNGVIANGLSLVHWEWGSYDNYVQAYLFWIYLASRTGDISTLRTIFNLNEGNPEEVDAWIATELGSDFGAIQLEQMIANWVQETTGPYGYGGLLYFPGASAPTVPAGTTSLNLEPFAGAFFKLGQGTVAYPGTQGSHIAYAGIDGSGHVDLTAPFDTSGVLVVVNQNASYYGWTTEHSGPDVPAVSPPVPWLSLPPGVVSPAWDDPPPLYPERRQQLYEWRERIRRQRGELP